jgi:hypothetical protein
MIKEEINMKAKFRIIKWIKSSSFTLYGSTQTTSTYDINSIEQHEVNIPLLKLFINKRFIISFSSIWFFLFVVIPFFGRSNKDFPTNIPMDLRLFEIAFICAFVLSSLFTISITKGRYIRKYIEEIKVEKPNEWTYIMENKWESFYSKLH